MTVINFAPKPLEVHLPFYRSSARERCLFGAFGSGKTYAIVDEAIAWCLKYPGIRGVVIRKTVPELRDATEPIFFERLPKEIYDAGKVQRSGGHVNQFTFPNGSVVMFRSVDDWQKFRSLNFGFICIDELNTLDEATYLGVISRLRQRDLTAEALRLGHRSEINRRGVFCATNPEGKDWCYRRFVDEDGNVPEPDTAWFRSTSFDNPYLAPDTLRLYMSFPDPWIRRYVLCTFDEFGGQIFENWNAEDHFIDPFELPKQNVVWMGFDPGTRNPTAGLWVYVDSEKRELIGIAEYEETNRPAVAHALSFRMLEAKGHMNVRQRIADPNINTRDRGSNMKLSDMYARQGYYFSNGPVDYPSRIPGLQQLIALNKFKLTRNCPKTFEAIKNYQWKDLTPSQIKNGEDARDTPLKKNDHLVDCAMYVASRYVSPVAILHDEADRNLTPFEQFSRDAHRSIKQQLGRKARKRHHPLTGVSV